MKWFFNDRVGVGRLRVREQYPVPPHFYKPTELHRYGFACGRWWILWGKDYRSLREPDRAVAEAQARLR